MSERQNWVIELRSGNYLQDLEMDSSGPLATALGFWSEADADARIRENFWISLAGGMPVDKGLEREKIEHETVRLMVVRVVGAKENKAIFAKASLGALQLYLKIITGPARGSPWLVETVKAEIERRQK